jgi:putative hydrolase of the HAD superfamily
MREFPQYPGIMADWPRVEAMPGAKEALDVLKDRYRIVVATNAANSDADQVRLALARAGLSESISSIFTPRQLGVRALESVLGVSPDRIVMVGDDYLADAFGPHRAGWHAICGTTLPSNPALVCCPCMMMRFMI